jgi:hypothetical protein
MPMPRRARQATSAGAAALGLGARSTSKIARTGTTVWGTLDVKGVRGCMRPIAAGSENEVLGDPAPRFLFRLSGRQPKAPRQGGHRAEVRWARVSPLSDSASILLATQPDNCKAEIAPCPLFTNPVSPFSCLAHHQFRAPRTVICPPLISSERYRGGGVMSALRGGRFQDYHQRAASEQTLSPGSLRHAPFCTLHQIASHVPPAGLPASVSSWIVCLNQIPGPFCCFIPKIRAVEVESRQSHHPPKHSIRSSCGT